MPSALEILRRDKEGASAYAASASSKRVRELLERAQAELIQRLAQAEGVGGPGSESFTAAKLRAVLAQVQHAVSHLTDGLKTAAVDQGAELAGSAVTHAVDYITRAEHEYRGSTAPLPFHTASMLDAAVQGARSSVLRRILNDPSHPGQPGVVARYGLKTVGLFEQALQQRLIQGKTTSEALADVIAQSPFLQGKPAFWGERILRTESMHAHNAAAQQTLEQVDSIVGDMLKILVATFDHRTGSDSIAVHGQVRRPTEPFNWWEGAYMHPPNRPNDREVVVPHSMAWPIPDALKPRSDAEVAARWVAEGRTGAPPPRPRMSTVDLAQVGKPPSQTTPMADLGVAPGSPADQSPAQVLKPPPEPVERSPYLPPVVRDEAKPYPGDGTIPELPGLLPELDPGPLPEPVDLLAEQIAPASGSNPGGVFRGSDGVDRYVKFYSDPTQAIGEHLANKVYESLGLGALKSELFEHDGKLAYASQMLPKSKRLADALDPKTAARALDGFAADVLLANWDAAGLGLDNMLVVPGGRVVRVDNGAALLSRAKGTRKPQHALDNPSEWKSFFNPAINPAYSRLAAAAGVSRPEDFAPSLIRSIGKIDRLAKKKGGWAAFVDANAPQLSPADRDRIVDMLTTRTAFLRSQLPSLRQHVAGQTAAPKPLLPITDAEFKVGQVSYKRRQAGAARFLQKNPVHHEVVRGYTGNDYKSMNRLLNEGPAALLSAGYTPAEIDQIMLKNQRIRDALVSAKAAGHAIEGAVYRGVVAWPGLMQEISSGEFGFKSTVSTTTDLLVARGFSGGSGPRSVLFHLRTKSAIPVKLVSTHAREAEAILPPGTRFRVISQRPWTDNGSMIVEAEEIE